MFGWIKKLFCKKEEEVIPPNPSPFIVKLLEWVESQTELPDCKCQYKKKDDKITDDWLQRGDSTTTYHFKHEDKIIEICNIATGATLYKDKYGLFASGEWRYSSGGSDIYLIRSVSLFSKVKQEWVEISTSTLLGMNINKDNKPYLEKIFDKVDKLYYSTSDERKEIIRRYKENKAKNKEIMKDESLKNIKDIYEKFDLQNRNWITEYVTIYSKNKSHTIKHPFSDRVEFKLINEKLYVIEAFKNVSYCNGEEIVSYSDDNKHCLDELFEKGVNVGFEIADWAFTGKPAEIRIDYKDEDWSPLLVWNITEVLLESK